MNVTEFFAVFGILVIMWWIGRRVAQALDRYELMKRQCETKIEARERRERRSEPRTTHTARYAVHPRTSGLR